MPKAQHLTVLVALALAAPGRADEPPVSKDVGEEKFVAAERHAELPADFVTVAQGAFLGVGVGASQSGDHLVGELGGESTGMRSKDGRWLLQWDALIAGRGGWLANQHPYTLFVGGHGRGAGELGVRLTPVSAWSPYFGGGLDASIMAMTHPGLAFNALNTINNSDGFGGLTAGGHIRAVGGLSFLESSRSLLLVAFVQERLRAPAINTPGAAFTEGGLAVRFDLAQRLTATLEASLGSTFDVTNSALHYTNHTIHEQLAASIRKKWGSGLWLAGSFSLGRDLESTTYTQVKTTYVSAHPQALEIGISFGVPIGSQE